MYRTSGSATLDFPQAPVEGAPRFLFPPHGRHPQSLLWPPLDPTQREEQGDNDEGASDTADEIRRIRRVGQQSTRHEASSGLEIDRGREREREDTSERAALAMPP